MRWGIAVLAAIVVFAGSFAIAHSVAGDEQAAAPAPVRQLPERLVTIVNLERAPTIKPLRSAPGAPPAAGPAPASP